MTQLDTQPERFQVNTEGMRQLHAHRRPEELVKELLQNVFDEDNATICAVTVTSLNPEETQVEVLDDAQGFLNINDAYTLMRPTAKRLDPSKRGRFNLGDKEFLSVALQAEIETVGHTVSFPRTGGRTVNTNNRTNGTIVRAIMPWNPDQAQSLTNNLSKIRPPEKVSYTVNEVEIQRAPPLTVHRASLPTVLQSEPGQPLRPTRRITDIEIIPTQRGTGVIYELGIPIQEIQLTEYDVDIQQKVPMPPNRDTVSESYLKEVYAHVLNAINERMQPEEFRNTWIRSAVEHPAVTPEAVQTTLKHRYGDKVVTWSSNIESNMQAIDQGYQVIHPRTMSQQELEQLRRHTGLQSANQAFKNELTFDPDKADFLLKPDQQQKDFANWVRKLAGYASMKIEVKFVENEAVDYEAKCTMNSSNPIMTINVSKVPDDFFQRRSTDQLELVIHELGHAMLNGAMSHGPQWGDSCSKIGAMIADGISRESQDNVRR